MSFNCITHKLSHKEKNKGKKERKGHLLMKTNSSASASSLSSIYPTCCPRSTLDCSSIGVLSSAIGNEEISSRRVSDMERGGAIQGTCMHIATRMYHSYNISYHVISNHAISWSYHMMSSHMMSYQIMSYQTISYHIIYHIIPVISY